MVDRIALRDASLPELEEFACQRLLALNQEELRTIQEYYRRENREPTLLELETIAQTWSEHCKHKTFRGRIVYQNASADDVCPSRTYLDLLKETIMQVSREIKPDWCISLFRDNAGIIAFDAEWALAFKVETHNHPSALEPYGGAGTGVGGVIRDILGAGKGAWPILNTDVFCFAPPDWPAGEVPAGILHPRRILLGVVAGVRDYGNRMGIPTANGAICFSPGYLANPLVFCGTVGILPRKDCFKEVLPDDLIVLLGGRTGRDGIHGATFSSSTLTNDIPASVVQIGNPITERKLLVALRQARDSGLFRAITDCGAGGLSSAVGELAADTGARVELEKVPLKYAGLAPWEIWISESQERMVLAVPPENINSLKHLCEQEDVEIAVIGRFSNDRQLRIFYSGELVGQMDLEFLHGGLPPVEKKAYWSGPPLVDFDPEKLERKFPSGPIYTADEKENRQQTEPDLEEIWLSLLSLPTVASKEWVIRQYDHEVQGATVLKPLVGVSDQGPADAVVLKPFPRTFQGVAVANGINPYYGMLDPYWMAAAVIEEAIRNLIVVGTRWGSIALLDNFCAGNPDKPACLAGLTRAAQACYDFARVYATPFISGKDSLYNEYREPQSCQAYPIPLTLLISSLGIVPDIRRIKSLDLKKEGNLFYLVGLTHRELGGSQYYIWRGLNDGLVPRVRAELSRTILTRVARALEQDFVVSAHDCSDGGLGTAIAEMAFSGGKGVQIELSRIPLGEGWGKTQPLPEELLFSESTTRFLLEVQPDKQRTLDELFRDIPCGLLGKVTDEPVISLRCNGKSSGEFSLARLESAWRSFSRHFNA